MKRAKATTRSFSLPFFTIWDTCWAPKEGLLLPSTPGSRAAVLATCTKSYTKLANKQSVQPLVLPISQSISLFCHRIFQFWGRQRWDTNQGFMSSTVGIMLNWNSEHLLEPLSYKLAEQVSLRGVNQSTDHHPWQEIKVSSHLLKMPLHLCPYTGCRESCSSGVGGLAHPPFSCIHTQS